MKRLVLCAAFLALLSPPAGADDPPTLTAAPTEARKIEGLGNLHHRVSTTNPLAQEFFDQGLKLTFAFNHDEAVRSFRRAAELDPDLAMAWWGVALALGPNINWPMLPESEKEALKAIAMAQKLKAKASGPERAYIEALAMRYSDSPKADRVALDNAYRAAMKKLASRYPDDLDAATLYAESIMDLNPWKFWAPDGTPAKDTPELVSVLEAVLRRDPWHIGANHYYIHAVEASPLPELAMGSAERLKGLTPGAGHLAHMPSHIFIRTGDYDQSARINDNAAGIDAAYIKAYEIGGLYPMLYYNHNLHFSAVAHALAGRYAEALESARKVTEHSKPMVHDMPMVEMFTPTTILVQTMFRRWDDILALEDPGPGLPMTRIIWHFARGMALADRGNAEAAHPELDALSAGIAALPPEATIGLNPATAVLNVPFNLLSGKIAEARNEPDQAVALFRKALAAEDLLSYDEPADWYLHVRPMLGGLLLRNGRGKEAEQVFRDDLARRPRDGRSLWGLMKSLEAQDKTYEAGLVRSEHEAAWRMAAAPVTLSDL